MIAYEYTYANVYLIYVLMIFYSNNKCMWLIIADAYVFVFFNKKASTNNNELIRLIMH